MATEQAGTDTTAGADTVAAATNEGAGNAATTDAGSGGKTLLGGQVGGKAAESANAEDAGDAVDGKDADKGEADGETPEAAKVPEKYEFELPEGVELDPAVLDTFTPVMKELGLQNDQANKLAQAYHQIRVGEAEKQAAAHDAQVSEWAKAVKDDAELGGKAFESTARHAQAAVQKFGSDGLRELLDSTGLGNHPELVRAFAKIGQGIAEDTSTLAGQSDAPPQKSLAELMYPNMQNA